MRLQQIFRNMSVVGWALFPYASSIEKSVRDVREQLAILRQKKANNRCVLLPEEKREKAVDIGVITEKAKRPESEVFTQAKFVLQSDDEAN